LGLLVFITGCLIWIPIAIWVLSLVQWMITGDIDVVSGIVGIGIAIGLGFISLDASTKSYAPLTFVAVLATIFMYPFVRSSLTRKELKSIDVEALERAYQALGLKPNNPVSKFAIARRVYALGMPGHAVKIAESALAYLPETHFLDEHRTLRNWKASVTNPAYFTPIACVECHTPNPPGNIHCAACGAPFLLDRARGKFVSGPLGRRLLAAWIGMVAVLAGIPATSLLPPIGQIAAILLLLAVAGVVLYLAFRTDSQTGATA
jgi:hypothetical protein